MKLCYVDESGGVEAEGSSSSATPLMVIAGVIVNHGHVRAVTADYLRTNQAYFPGLLKKARRPLDRVLTEIKSTEVRRRIRSARRDDNRHAIGYLDQILALFEQYNVRIIGRVWVKKPGAQLDCTTTYTYAIQDLARHFDHLLSSEGDVGLVVCDGRRPGEDHGVSHSVFTQKHRQAGDALPRLVESPLFGASHNHVGLQLADLLAGALLFPMACRVYCQGCTASSHMHPNYDRLSVRYAARLRRLQHLYHEGGRVKGGVVVSDARGQRPSRDLFTTPVAPPSGTVEALTVAPTPEAVSLVV